MSESELIGGIYPKPRHENAPDFVIGKLSINVEQFREWMKSHLRDNPDAEWIKIDMKVSKAGKGYAVLDTWKPDGSQQAAPQQPAQQEGFTDDDIPF